MSEQTLISMTNEFSAKNYKPLDVVLDRGEGIWLWDVKGKKYLDMLSAYSALNHGHLHPTLITAMKDQLSRLTLTSRAFHNDQLGYFAKDVCELVGKDMMLPMNTGAEAVETALKAARKWGVEVKGVAKDKAEIIVCSGNFHGRTISIISFSSDDQYKHGFGPLTPGFKTIPFGNIDALKEAITDTTVGFLFEPIQGEAGVIVPPDGFLEEADTICKENNVLMIADEIQTGLGRTGKLFCYEHYGINPDIVILGKALGGGVYPVSAVVANKEILGVFRPGDHGSTFGGNPLGCAVGRAAIRIIKEENLVLRAEQMGHYLIEKLHAMNLSRVKDIRGKGLLVGIEMEDGKPTARMYCERLQEEGILCKETHDTIIRFAPPLIIQKEDIDWALQRIENVFDKLG